MVRISDILKLGGGFPEPEPPGKKKSEEPAKEKPTEHARKEESGATQGASISNAMTGSEGEAEKEMQVASAMHHIQLDPEESKRIYQRAMEIIKEIFDKIKSEAIAPNLKEAEEIVKVITDRIVLGDRELVTISVSCSENNYLYEHAANVCILSIDIGLGLGYNKSRLNELGLAAFIHDIGMTKVMDIIQQPRRLNEQEFAEIKKHPIYGFDILSEIENIQEAIIQVVKQEHERLQGTGYPEGLKDEQIHEYAKIVAIVDVYEALVHPRSYRGAITPHGAIKELLSMNSTRLFETRILKVLIDRIGLYPVGCWVELNTGEIGKVASPNKDTPLKPNVNIVFSPEGKKMPQMELIDLSQHANVYIKHSINPQETDLKFE